MEYVDGISIAEYCKTRRLPIRQRVRLFMQVTVAVQFLHDYGIVHRDITPSNLLVTTNGSVKVVDFGISNVLDPNTRPVMHTAGLSRMMTPAYASPEQLTRKKLSRHSDIYSMGAILHELVTGILPGELAPPDHNNKLSLRTVRSVKPSDGVDAKSASNAGLPENAEQARTLLQGSLDNILLRALENDPGLRYSTSELFRIDLVRYLEELSPARPNRTLSLLKKLRHWAKSG